MKIAFLLTWAYGMGGLVRTTVNTANHFAEQGHEVRLISFLRHTDEPFFAIRADVKVQPLVDIRPGQPVGGLDAWQRHRPSIMMPPSEGFYNSITLRGDYRLARTLFTLDADVLITTRPAWNLAAARWAPRHTLLIGQDHLNFTQHDPDLHEEMRRWYPRLDAMVTLTKADRRDYQQLLKGKKVVVRAIGNAVSAGPHPRSTQDAKVVVAAGRLVGQKRYSHLIRAFAKVVAVRPDWSLRIFGDGPNQEALQDLIDKLGLADHVSLMGRTTDTESEFAKASIMAMSSKFEGFPMVILEAFACGLPVVSYNCPRGPGEMIKSGRNGLLVKDSSVPALARGLLRLIEDDELRRTMSGNALESADVNAIEHVGDQWMALFDKLRTDRQLRSRRRIPRRALLKALPRHQPPRPLELTRGASD